MSIPFSVRDTGPIVEFEHTMEAPGLHVLKGKHGVGKSICLRSVQLATDGRTDTRPTKRDGTKRGEVTVAGKTLRITSQIREEGDLSVEGLGDLDLAGLHSPRYDKPETRDRHRIKALTRLAGVEANATLFHDLTGGRERFEKLVDADALKTDDLVEMAGRVKRSLEKHALAKEEDERTALSRARASAEIAEGVDLSAPHDATELQARLTTAIAERVRITTQRRDGLERIAQADRSNAALVSAQAGQTKSVAMAEADLQSAQDRQQLASVHVRQIEEKLAEARNRLAQSDIEVGAALRVLDQAKSFAVSIAAWQADIDAGAKVVCPSVDDVTDAEQAVENANAAVTLGARVRQAIEAKAAAVLHSDAAKDAGKYAQRLRDAARDTQDVLSDAIARIPNCPLKIRTNEDGDARLVLKTDRSDAECFDELSDGERWRILIPLACKKNRMIVIPQAAFGEMADSMRSEIDQIGVENECYLLTAQADDGELRCESFSNSEPVGVAND